MSESTHLDSTDRYYAAVRLIAECKVNAWMMGGCGPYIGEAFWRWLAAELAGNIEDVLAAMEQIQKEPTFFPNSDVQARFAQIDFDEADPITQLLDTWAHEHPEALEGDMSNGLPLADYAPNDTCPFCMDATSPTHGDEMHWDGTTLTIRQTCPECGQRWNEEWELTSLRTVKDDESPPSKW